MHTVSCIFASMNFMLFRIKLIMFKTIIKFKQFELYNYAPNKTVSSYLRTLTTWHCPHSPPLLQ